MRKILVIGATSAIAQATIRLFAADGDAFFLVARNPEKLDAVANDLVARGAASVDRFVADMADFSFHESIVTAATESLGDLDIVLVAHGILGSQENCERSYAAAGELLTTNFLSVVSLLTVIANLFEARKNGLIAVISSVAGDRGRVRNYVYGTSKGALSIFLQGLRSRLHPFGVHVLTVKPGFVDTPMTSGFDKGILFSSPGQIGSGIYEAIVRKKEVVYLPFYWRYVMAVLKHIPEAYFKRFRF